MSDIMRMNEMSFMRERYLKWVLNENVEVLKKI